MNKKLLILCCLIIASCSKPDTSWYPLQEGFWWQYAATRYIRGEQHLQKLIVATLPTRKIEGKAYHPKKRADGRVNYYQRSDGGIYRYDPETRQNTLVLNETPTLGASWKSSSRIRFLEVTGAFEQTYNRRIKQDIIIEYTIESLDDIVKVPAGRFTNAIRVKGKGSLYGGGGSLKEFMDLDTINIETMDWYVPGVGLIKSMRKEFTFPVKFENNYVEVLEKFHNNS